MAPMASTDPEKPSPTTRNDTQSERFAVQIREQLRRILCSRLFTRSHQAASLLTFLVEEALSFDPSATRNNLKEYSVAIHVFGRAVNFDPSSDNIVRVEVRRVRAKLESYYAGEGNSDPILISIPKGAYVPVFQTRDYSDVDLSGHTISHYELVRRRCANKWQALYDANCLHLNRSVTVIIPSRLTLEDESRRQRLLTDTQRAVDHPNVAAIHDVETPDERLIIAAASLPGRRLNQVVEQGTLAGQDALTLARELASALASGHSKGIFHGILTPDSITFDEVYPQVHILPFGLSSLVDIEYPAYDGFRAPEWGDGYAPDLTSDVWAFGALVWFATVGEPPPPAQPVPEGVHEIRTMPPPLAKVVAKCLQPDPSSRYASATEVLQDILQISDGPAEPIEAVRTSVTQPAESRKALILAAILLGIFVLVLSVTIGFRREAAKDPNLRVVVLPLDNVGGGAENDAYCRVIAELLAAKLARLPGAQVVSSRSIDPKHGPVSTEFLQQKLGVQYAVDGSLLKSGTAFQATVRLIRVADGSYAWTESYNGPWTEISARIDELAEKAAQTMGLVVHQEQKRLPPARPAATTEAYDQWLKGRFAAIEYWNTLAPAHYEDAERRLRRALEVQPGYVDAMADLGQLYLSAAYPPKGNQKELLDKAQNLAELAVTLDPDNGRAQTLLGGVYTDTGRARLAMPYLLHAMEITPHDPNPRNSMSLAYEAMGFWESAAFERDRAVERDPLLKGIQWGRAVLLARLGRVQEATKIVDSFPQQTPQWGSMMARIYLIAGKPNQAEAVLIKSNPRDSQDPFSFGMLLALSKAAQGHPDIARVAVKQFKSPERQRGVHYAVLCALAGEKELLVEEIKSHTYYRNYRWLVSEPVLRPYRNYPPYQKLVRDLHQEWQRNLTELGRYLPVQPIKLPHPDEYLSQR
jgi:serine/threonine protein kinase/Flp pilus assembly protein TadD